jgi:prepilin-type N-terminal cleavage/methylation domain-containing protein
MCRQTKYSRRRTYSEFIILNSEFACRRGYTMAELMIVVVIMLMLVAVTLPVAKKVMDDSHVREASRQLQAYLQMAKARAIHTGRPCGLYLECKDRPLGYTEPAGFQMIDPVVRAVTELHLAEVPAPYSGGTLDICGKVANNYFLPWYVGATQQDDSEMAILQSLLYQGETFEVRFDFKGDWHRFQYIQNGQYPNLFQFIGGTSNISPPTVRPVPFQIRRAPRKVGNPLAMPTGTCIDMRYSGVGPTADRFPVQPSRNMTILFTPNGGVDDLVVTTENRTTNPISLIVNHAVPIGTIYFLIGKVDKVNDPFQGAKFYDIRDSNLADPTSLWVTVGRGNGQVTTSENTPDPTQAGGIAGYMKAARQVATSREQMKGR